MNDLNEVLDNDGDDCSNAVEEAVDKPSSEDEDAVNDRIVELESKLESPVNIVVNVVKIWRMEISYWQISLLESRNI